MPLSRRAAAVAALFVAALLVFRRYYLPDGLLFEDANLPWSAEIVRAAVVQFFHSWNPAFGGGMSSIIMNSTTFAPFTLQAAISPLGVPLSTVLIYPAILVTGFGGAYVLAREFDAPRFGAAMAALFSIGNPWFLERMLFGHLAILCAAALVPWLFWAVRRQRRAAHPYGMLVVLLAAADLQADVRIAYLAFAGLFIVAGLRAAAFVRRAGTSGGFAILRAPSVLYLAAAPFAALALNLWWTAPFFAFANVNPVHPFYPPLEDVRGGCKDCDLRHALYLSGTWLHFSWTKMTGYGPAAGALWFAAFSVVGATCVLFRPALSRARALAACTIVAGVLLSTGTTYVSPEAVYWLYAHIPFAAFFRDPNKFGFVASTGIVVALACVWRSLNRGFAVALALCIAFVCAPLFIGEFSVASGAGFQAFSERPHFIKLMDYLRGQPGFGEWRVAMLPPWLAEQSLAPGLWYTANPLVFQLEAPTMDAKLISTGTAMNQTAWRTFDNLYWGTDRHPARSLARLGIRYVVAIDGVTISDGANFSPYYGAPTAPVQMTLLSDPAIREVYHDGRYHLYFNGAYTGQIRTAAYPLIAGAPSDQLRAALPAGTLGDSVTAPPGSAMRLSAPAIAIGESPYDRCLARPEIPKVAAIDFVAHRAEWGAYWVASDYLQTGTGDALLDRVLQRFSLPFAVSRGGAPLDVPIVAARPAHVALEAAGLTAQTLIHASIDGGAPIEWQPSAVALSWRDLGSVPAGRHVITIVGSKAGTVVKSVALAPANCAAGGIEVNARGTAAGPLWFVPGPITWVRLPSTLHAAAWDGVPVPAGVPFASLTGTHELVWRHAGRAERRRMSLPSSAVHLIDGAVPARAAPAARPIDLRSAADGASLATVPGAVRFFDPQGGALNRLHLRGARAAKPTHELLTAYYKTTGGQPAIVDIADFTAGPVASDIDLAIPAAPYETAFALAIRARGGPSGLTWRSAQLTGGPPEDGGYFVRFPTRMPSRAAHAVSPSERRFERFDVPAPPAAPLVADFSYDVNWSYGNAPHFVANGMSNLWDTGEAGSGTYGPQRAYEFLLLTNGLLWCAAIGLTIVLFARARPSAPGGDG